MPKYVFHETELEVTIPPLHTGVRNLRLVRAEQVGGRFEMVLGQAGPGGSAEPHYHEAAFQVYYILEGRGQAQIGEEPPADFGPGSVIVIPPGVVHSVWASGGRDARVIVIYSPPLPADGFKKTGGPSERRPDGNPAG
jgi:mannose-6-phosphate isomerase-like protein (cupin superfamily)